MAAISVRNSPIQGMKRRVMQREYKFFPQFRISKGVRWQHTLEINKDNGFNTIEACNDEIDRLEREEMRATGKISEWRIKEQLV